MAEDCDYILELVKENHLVSDDQIAEGWAKVAASSSELNIIDALKLLGYLDENQLLSMLCEQYGLELVDLSEYEIPEDVAARISPELAKQYKIVPVRVHDDILTIAMGNPTDMDTVDALRVVLQCDIDAVVAPQEQIDRLYTLTYGSDVEKLDLASVGLAKPEDIQQVSDGTEDGTIGKSADTEEDAPIIKLVSQIIINAFNMKASDIHMEPMEKRYRIRYRIDGALREQPGPPKYLQPNITSRLKIMAHMDISEKRIPLDGRIQIKLKDKDIDLRVSSIPTTHGESIVMRILDKSSIQLDIPKLGFYSDDQEKINRIINYPDGIFLVTGPTGSGKTTSLYAFLNTINTPTRKIITVEDPVEYMLPGINQVQVNVAAKMTFAAALKAMLRQAPNIIMVGEIRDLETAEIAINASQTGHLVFSTLHTNDAPSAVTRLVDMGVKPFLVASSVRAVMAQRLLRRVCKNCGEPTTADPTEIRMLGLDDKFLSQAKLMKGRGCSVCGGTGYKGRVGIYEIFMLTDEMQDLIYKKVAAATIREAARKSGMRTLREDALRKAASGITTLSEVIAATVGDVD
ncbi:MAG: ATPase, T2SS/T4P/T4SS family [bacterium]|nr:ATPase, T2SS/T4P/T4SS family [bacterium]